MSPVPQRKPRGAAPRKVGVGIVIDHDALALAAQALPPLSNTAVRLTQLFADESWEVDDVVQAISFDAPLTGRILRAANSAGIGGANRIGSVEQAVFRMGSGMIVRLAVGVAVRSTVSRAIPLVDAGESDLWHHSVAAAVMTEVIPLVTRRRIPPEAFTASLLHDVGRIIMYDQLDERAIAMIKVARQAGESPVEAERAILAADHGEIGALVAQAWNLPDVLVHAIRLHETPAVAVDHRTRDICDLVKVSDAGARRNGHLGMEEQEDASDLADSMQRLGLDAARYDEACALAQERYAEVLSQFE